MRILHMITGLNAGGAERVTTDLAGAQAALGHDVLVCSLLGHGHFSDTLERRGVPVVDLGFRRRSPPLTGFHRTVGLLRDWSPDVVHTTMFHANVVGRVARLLAPVGLLVTSVQNTDERGDGNRPVWRASARGQLYRLTNRLADLTTQVSQPGADLYVRRKLVSRDRMCFVPNATNTTEFRPDAGERATNRSELGLEAGEHLFLNVGSFNPQKAQVELIHAFAEAFHASCERLAIVGDGPLRPELEAAVRSVGLSDRVLLVGVRRDVAGLLNAADVFVLPSIFEGMPLALLEAMACGKPCICTDVGANRVLVVDGTTGTIIPPADRPALVLALREMATLSEHERSEMGRLARRRVEEAFSITAVAESWLKFYSMASADRRPSRRGRPLAPLAQEVWRWA